MNVTTEHWQLFAAMYVIPALLGIVLGLGLSSWTYLAFEPSLWIAVTTAMFVLLAEKLLTRIRG